jgi:hypothetical protein
MGSIHTTSQRPDSISILIIILSILIFKYWYCTGTVPACYLEIMYLKCYSFILFDDVWGVLSLHYAKIMKNKTTQEFDHFRLMKYDTVKVFFAKTGIAICYVDTL